MGNFRNYQRILIASVMCVLFSSSVSASNVRITGENPREDIEVSVKNARTADVLRQIGKRFKFEIRGLDKTGGSETYTVTFKGNLEKVLQHLLRNRNHLIVRSSSEASGIRRIVILDNKIGVGAPSQTTARRRPGQPRGKLNEKERLRRLQFLTRAIKKRAAQPQ